MGADSLRSSQQESGDKSKPEVIHAELGPQPQQEFDPMVRKRLIRKLDLRLLIWSFLAYFANLLDRNNMQNAFTNGMEEDLNLNSDAYNWAVTMFFIGYIVLQIPGNVIITKLPPRWVLPTVVVVWGCVVSMMSLVQNHPALWGLRLCLGLSEAAFYPGMMFILGSWYTKEELGKRTMFFGTGNQISGAFGGLIAGAIAQNLDGAGGLRGWRWLFIIEGLIGVTVGLAGYFLLPNFPHNTSWISEEERQLAVQRQLAQGKKVVSTAYNWRTVANVLLTPYAWLFVINFACIYIGNNMSLNFAIILRDMGYSRAFANYMNTPCYIFGAIITVLIGWSSDRSGDRAFHLAGVQCWVSIWFMILAIVNRGNNPTPLVFVATYAITSNISMPVLALTWVGEIFKADHNSRAVVIAFVNAIGNLAPNFVNVRAWVVSDSPYFFTGKITSMAMGFASVILTLVTWYLVKINFMIPRAVEKVQEHEVDKSSVDDVGAKA